MNLTTVPVEEFERLARADRAYRELYAELTWLVKQFEEKGGMGIDSLDVEDALRRARKTAIGGSEAHV